MWSHEPYLYNTITVSCTIFYIIETCTITCEFVRKLTYVVC